MMSAMQIEDIRQRLRSAGAKPVHAERVLRHWARAWPQHAGKRRIGERLKSESVPVTALWSSQWCRARDTAALFALGPVREVGAFNSFFGTHGDEGAQTAAARKLLLGWRERGTLVVVTHQVNIRALTGQSTSSAEGVVLRRDGDRLQVVGRVRP